MSGGTGDPIRTVDGVTLYREHLPDAFDYPAVSLHLRSDRDERASIRLTKTLPPALAAGQVGFHPDYGQGGWTVEERTIRYETVVPPNGEVTTLYAIQTDAPNPFERIESPPSLDVEPLDDGRANGESDAEAGESDRPDDGTRAEPERQDPTEATAAIGWFKDGPAGDSSDDEDDQQRSGTDDPEPREDDAADAETADDSVGGAAATESTGDADEPDADAEAAEADGAEIGSESVEGDAGPAETEADGDTAAGPAVPETNTADAGEAADVDERTETDGPDGDADRSGDAAAASERSTEPGDRAVATVDGETDDFDGEDGETDDFDGEDGETDDLDGEDGETDLGDDTAARRRSTDGTDSALGEAVARIEAGEVTPEQRRRLVEAIAAEAESGSDLASRIERLQRRMRRRRNLQVVSEVVHDRRGPLDQVLDDLETRIDGLESSTSYLGENLALTAEHAQQVEDRLDDRLLDVTDDVADVEAGLGTLDDRMDDVTDELRDLRERVETLERTIASLGGIVDRIETLEARTETVEANADAIAALREDVEALHDATGRDPTDGSITGDSASDGWRDPETGPDGRTEPGTRNAQDDP